MSAAPTPNKVPANKTRSPNYPSMNLEEAIGRLGVIYETQRRYPATRDVLARLMGYGSLNGASATTVSALAKYGLIEGHGDNLRVSEMGQDLMLHRKGDPEYTTALRTAAFMPAFFRELHEQYPYGLPGEHAVRAVLTKRGFNPKAIDGAVRAYRDTMEFVDADTGGAVAESPVDSLPEVAMQTQPFEAVPMDSPHPSTLTRMMVLLPASRSAEIIFRGGEPTQRDLEFLRRHLELSEEMLASDGPARPRDRAAEDTLTDTN